jgi:hypothetical protein
MTPSGRRVLRQVIPLAVVILALGSGRQYAAGGGVFQAETGLLAKARAALAQWHSEIAPEAAASAEPVTPAAPFSPDALASALADQPAATPFQPQRFPGRPITFSSTPRSTCRH